MKLRKADWLFVLATGLIVLLVSLLPSPRDRNPPVPDTQHHRQLRMEGACSTCYGSDKSRPFLRDIPSARAASAVTSNWTACRLDAF